MAIIFYRFQLISFYGAYLVEYLQLLRIENSLMVLEKRRL